MKVSISRRKTMQPRTVLAVQREAEALGAHAYPVISPKGLDEVLIYNGGGAIASIFRPDTDGLALWRPGRTVVVGNVKEAVSRALTPPVKIEARPTLKAA